MLRGSFEHSSSLSDQVDNLTQATITLWNQMIIGKKPTPSKFHYVFNMRDISRVFQGILFSPINVLETAPHHIVTLWLNECERVFCDKLLAEDKPYFFVQASKLIHEKWPWAVPQCEEWLQGKNQGVTQYADFMGEQEIDPETEAPLPIKRIYSPYTDIKALADRVTQRLDEYNALPVLQRGGPQMLLVLFEDALGHLIRISRIIGRPRGNALLVGIGGSGRQSLSKLAAFISEQVCFRLSLTSNYRVGEFKTDLKKIYVLVGKEGKRVTWVITDFELVFEDMLEYINAIMMTGEVAKLFDKDELGAITADLRNPAKKEDPSFDDTPDNLYKFFVDRIRDNLHICMCFSPTNEKFAERARKFPGLMTAVIDWFLPWPEQALQDVSSRFLTGDSSFKVVADASTQRALVNFFAKVHLLTNEACSLYFEQYRRQVHVTPKSYLAFIKMYKDLYNVKLKEFRTKKQNVDKGLQQLAVVEGKVGELRTELDVKTKEVKVAEAQAEVKSRELEVGAKIAAEAKGKADIIQAECEKKASTIQKEKDYANSLLDKAKPLILEAEAAAATVTGPAIKAVCALPGPPNLLKRTLDTVLILMQQPLVKCERLELNGTNASNDERYNGGNLPFLKDSWNEYAKPMMSGPTFLNDVLLFLQDSKRTTKDGKEVTVPAPAMQINEETMELLEPYMNVYDYNKERISKSYGQAVGLLVWCYSMKMYHKAALITIPLQDALAVKESNLAVAMSELKAAKDSSEKAQKTLDELHAAFERTEAAKKQLKEEAAACQDKMRRANELITSLSGEKDRWTKDQAGFAGMINELVGNAALACAFVSYLGPFGFEFRKMLMQKRFTASCQEMKIPCTSDLAVTKFLADDGTVAQWNSEGLPKDELSLQNGILVVQASRVPLLVDPQAQASGWLKKKCEPKEGSGLVLKQTSVTDPKVKKHCMDGMQFGYVLFIDGVSKDLDPIFDNMLEKNLIPKGKKFQIQFGDAKIDFENTFQVFLFTNQSNPRFSPELSAKTTIIDFSVTQKGLEDQLLSRVIQTEQRQLEEQRLAKVEEVNQNTIFLQKLDAELLFSLSNATGDILANVVLIELLASTKINAEKVKKTIEDAEATQRNIDVRREQYRPVAARGSVLYFVMTSLSLVNCMYQTSLAMFLTWFDGSMYEDVRPYSTPLDRVKNLIETFTIKYYQNITRGIFERDKNVFKLMMAMNILRNENPDEVTVNMINVFLQGKNSISNPGPCPAHLKFLDKGDSYANVMALVTNIKEFGDLKSAVEQDKEAWDAWFQRDDCENQELPGRLEERLKPKEKSFLRLMLVRSFREDRARFATSIFIGTRMGKKFIEPIPFSVASIHADSSPKLPVIMMLSPGADPTAMLTDFSKGLGLGDLRSVSMGEGQEKPARKIIDQGQTQGSWALLNNCHLGLGFMAEIPQMLKSRFSPEGLAEFGPVNDAFRLFITCEPNINFPIELLQLSIKVTLEPPAGLKAGLLRSFSGNGAVMDQERFSRQDHVEWRNMVFSFCFLHSIVQERRKYGSIGWCIPYEYNTSDLEACLTFLQNHFQAIREGTPSWPTIQFMVAEAQYGGRITDDRDRKLFNAYARKWLTETKEPFFSLIPANSKEPKDDTKFTEYSCIRDYDVKATDSATLYDMYLAYINKFPDYDDPQIFGLHRNADITYGNNETLYLLETITDTRPKESGGGGGGETTEDKVRNWCLEQKDKVPKRFNFIEVRRKITEGPGLRAPGKKDEKWWIYNKFVNEQNKSIGPDPGPNYQGDVVPLNVFLRQECERLDNIIAIVYKTLDDLILAIKGEIIMTPLLQAALLNIGNRKPPMHWYKDPSGAFMAWNVSGLSSWFTGLLDRHFELTQWLNTGRPSTFWLTGYFNPTGFLTCIKQEVTRASRFPGDKPGREGLDYGFSLDMVELWPFIEKVADEGKKAAAPEEGQKKEEFKLQPHAGDGKNYYIRGLYIEGCRVANSKSTDSGAVLAESLPQYPLVSLPLIKVTAIARERRDAKLKDKNIAYYGCPVYTVPKRTEQFFVTTLWVPCPSLEKSADYWAMRGVAMLCTKEA